MGLMEARQTNHNDRLRYVCAIYERTGCGIYTHRGTSLTTCDVHTVLGNVMSNGIKLITNF